jgi:hypothetical protein
LNLDFFFIKNSLTRVLEYTCPIWHVYSNTRVKLFLTRVFKYTCQIGHVYSNTRVKNNLTRVLEYTCQIGHVYSNTRVKKKLTRVLEYTCQIGHVYSNTRVKLCSLWLSALTRVIRVSKCTCLNVWHVYDTVHVSNCTWLFVTIFVVI